ncbi:MAG: hypothetical protein ACM3SY_18190 [Candidatus Omnitrophota bacterium]
MTKPFLGFLVIGCVMFMIGTTMLSAQNGPKAIDPKTIDSVKETLLKQYGEGSRERIERGLQQVALFWTKDDGTPEEFSEFCKTQFIGSEEALDANFKRLEMDMESLFGYFNEMRTDLKQALDLTWGPIQPIDMAMGEYNPSAHLIDDLFANKIAFAILLNYPHYSLEEKIRLGETWNRKQWALARMGDGFMSRVPASVSQDMTKNFTQAEAYIADYNIYMGELVDNAGKTHFPADMKLLSHWNLRDELRARYNDPNGLFKQMMIYKVMDRIINQEIPGVVVNSPTYQWNPFTNKVYEKGKNIQTPAEPDTRYAKFLNLFKSIKKSDSYNPYLPTHIKRMFEGNRELTEAEVESLFKELMSSKEVAQVAALIQKRLNRKLQPFDIWYNGFRTRSAMSAEELDKIVAAKYPTAQAFENDIENILMRLGFADDRAKAIAAKIRVDPARGSGHCSPSLMRSAKSRLRTRVPEGGMNYKGYNIAIHELGHAVESVLDLDYIDYYSLSGVPNIAFTEAFAFLFQQRDLELLGIKQDDPQAKYLEALDIFWQACESMADGLMDMKVWNWLYSHPEATPADLKKAVIAISKDIWNQYYAPAFKIKDQPITAIYSHMIDSALYLPDYAIGYLIQFQIETYMEGKVIGKEMERMCLAGRVIPQLWMKNAVGEKISVKPLLDAVDEALKNIK